MVLRPLVGQFRSLLGLSHEAGIVALIGSKQTSRIGHHSRKIERCRDALRYDVPLLLALRRHDERLEVGGCELVIDATVVGVLHREEPTEVEHHLVEEVGRLVAALRDVGVEGCEIVGKLFVGSEHQADAERGVDHILVVVAGIVPAVGRTDDGTCRTLLSSCRWMDEHLRVGMTERTVVCPTPFDGHTRADEVEQTQRGLGDVAIRTFGHQDISRLVAIYELIASGCRCIVKNSNVPHLARQRRGNRTYISQRQRLTLGPLNLAIRKHVIVGHLDVPREGFTL